jgi:hypothetical protein
MDSTSAKVLFVGALFAGIAGLILLGGAAMEHALGFAEDSNAAPVSLEHSGKTILAASAVLFAASLLAGKRSHGLHAFFSRPRVWSITIRVPSFSPRSRTQVQGTVQVPPPLPMMPTARHRSNPVTYVSRVSAAPVAELIASCDAIRLNAPAPQLETVPVRRTAGRYR